jgi:hypothetical protein
LTKSKLLPVLQLLTTLALCMRAMNIHSNRQEDWMMSCAMKILMGFQLAQGGEWGCRMGKAVGVADGLKLLASNMPPPQPQPATRSQAPFPTPVSKSVTCAPPLIPPLLGLSASVCLADLIHIF